MGDVALRSVLVDLSVLLRLLSVTQVDNGPSGEDIGTVVVWRIIEVLGVMAKGS